MQIIFLPHYTATPLRLDRPVAPSQRYDELIGRLSLLLPLYVPQENGPLEADREHWVENMTLLIAAIDTRLPVFVRDRDDASNDCPWFAFNTEARRPAEDQPTIILGPLKRFEGFLGSGGSRYLGIRPDCILWPHLPSMQAANNYASLAAFKAMAGRQLELADIPGDTIAWDSPNALAPAMRRLLDRVKGPMVAKIVAQAKYAPLERIDISRGASLKQIQAAIEETFEWSLVHLQDTPDGMLLQQEVPMHFEYRIMVIDGKPRLGAGCVEDLHPLDNNTYMLPPNMLHYDDKMQSIRRPLDAVKSCPGYIHPYHEAAKAFARQAAVEKPSLLDYTLDLARNDKGEIMVIEINPLPNAGLYAINVRAYVHQIVAATQRRAKTPPIYKINDRNGLCWSNDQGWVDAADPAVTQFSAEERQRLNLPIGEAWTVTR